MTERLDDAPACTTRGGTNQVIGRRHPYIEGDNTASLQVYRRLKQAVQECEPHAAPYLNLVSVFFHDLMWILTGYAVRVREVEGPYRPQTPAEWSPLHRLPYLGFLDVEKGVDPDAKTYGLIAPEIRPKRRWASTISRLIGPFVGARRTVAIGKPSALVPRDLVVAALRARMQVTFPSPAPLAIPGLSDQVQHLNRAIEAIFEECCWPASPKPVVEVVNRHIEALAVEGPADPVAYDALICGSLSDPFNRLLAARSRAVGVPVVQVSHSAGDGILDEPAFGYGERSFASAMLGFGPGGADLTATAEYAETLTESPVYFESDAPGIRGLYQGPEVPHLSSIDGKRVFYVPTAFAGNHRYGPFHDIPDRMYLAWQEALFREFPEAVWKGHPKVSTEHGLIPNGAKSISRAPLQQCLEEADVFIFDHLSTAFCVAAATSKPIIFFDIGMRNSSEGARRAMYDRCIYLETDPTDARDLRERVLTSGNEPAVNTFTDRFSLATSPSTSGRAKATVTIVDDLLQDG